MLPSLPILSLPILAFLRPWTVAGMTSEEEVALFNAADKDASKSISEHEFMDFLWANRRLDMSSFNKADADKDGFLSGDELAEEESPGRSFQRFLFFTKEEGKLSSESYIKALQELWSERIQPFFLRADENSDLGLDIVEFIPIYEKLSKRAKDRHFNLEKNGSGIGIEQWKRIAYHGRFEEHHELGARFFESADSNGDEILTLSEYMENDKSNTKEGFDAMIPSDQKDRNVLSRKNFDGYLADDFHVVSLRTFEDADVDNDGALSYEEFTEGNHFGHVVKLEL